MKEKTYTTSRIYAVPWILLFLVINLFLLVNGVGKTFARQALDDLIERELPPYYSLTYDVLEFSLIDKELSINNLRFIPDTSIQYRGVDRSFQVTIPHFNIRLKSINAILYDKELIIDGITVVDPQFSILDFSAKEQLTASTETLNLFDLIRQYLSLFRVNSFEVQNAGLEYARGGKQAGDLFSIKEIDFSVNGFALDSALTRLNFLNAESIELIVNKQLFYLSDNIHRVSFDQFHMSTRDSVLSFSNVVLEPRPDFEPEERHKSSLYYLKIPEIDLAGVDYYESYLNNDLRIEKVIFKEPEIRLRGGTEENRKNRGDKNVLLDILAQFAPRMYVQHIQLQKARVMLDLQATKMRDFRFVIDHINLFDCFLDPLNLSYSQDSLPFQDFNFQISNYRERLPDRLHVLTVKEAEIPARKSGIYVRDFRIRPYTEKAHLSKTKVEQQFPFLSIEGIDYLGFLFGDPLEISRIYLKEPVTRIIMPLEKQRDSLSSGISLEEFKSSITGSFVQDLRTRDLLVQGGRWMLDDWVEVEEYDFQAREFQLNENTSSWKALADTLSLQLKSGRLKQGFHNLKLAQLNTNGRDHELRGIQYQTTIDSNSYRLKLGRLSVYNTDLDSLFKQKYTFDSLQADQLQAQVDLRKKGGGQAFNPWTVKMPFSTLLADLNDASVQLNLANGDSLSFDGFHADLRVDSFLNLKNLHLKNIHFTPRKSTHKWALSQLEKLNGSGCYQLSGLAFIPKDTLAAVTHPMLIPEMTIIEWDRQRFFEKKEWSFKKVILEKPIFSVTPQHPNAEEETKNDDRLPFVILDSLQLNNARFNYARGDSVRINFPLLDLSVQGINTKKQMLTSAGLTDLFRSAQIDAEEGAQFFLPRMENRISSFQASIEEKTTVSFKNIGLKMEENSWSHETRLDHLTIGGLALAQLMKKKVLVVDSVSLGPMITQLAVKKTGNDSTGVFPEEWKLPLIKALDIGRFRMHEAHLDLDIDMPLQLDRIRLYLEGIRTDSLIRGRQMEEYYKKMELNLSNVSYTTGKYDEYQLSQQMEYRSEKKQLLLTDVQLVPQYSKEQFSSIIPHQEDLFDIRADSLVFHGFEWSGLFDPALHWPKIELKNLDLDIFRDQNPVHPNKPQDLVQEQIKSIPFPFLVDTLEVTTDIHFSILPEATSEAGEISFTGLEGRLMHITNLDSLWTKPMKLRASGNLYEDVPLEASVDFDMADPMNGFTLSGRVGKMEIPVMNKILHPTARIYIRKGRNKEITFDISANKDVAIGDMFFRYNKLKFRIVDKDDIHHTSLGNSLLTFWANRLVKSNNPSFLRKRKGVIYFERNPNRAIFHYWSRALLSGIVSSVGVKNNRKQLKKLGYENLEALNYQELFGEKEEKKEK